MKKNILLSNAAIAIVLFTCSSCATLVNNYPVVTLYHYSKDMKIQEDGKDVTLVESFAAHKKAGYAIASTDRVGSGGTNYYTTGIQLEAKPKQHVLTIEKGGKKSTVTVNGSMSGFYFFVDLFTSGPIGLIVDASTKKWRVSNPGYLDVTAALGETPVVSRHQLKKEFLKNASGK